MANAKTAAKKIDQSQELSVPAYQRKQTAVVADSPSSQPSVVQTPNGVRMPAINDVQVAGRLGSDPVVRTVGNQQVANFNLAVEKKYLDPQDQWQKQVSWVPVAAWGAVAERAQSFLHKGSPVYVKGQLRSSSWKTKEGENRTTLRLEAFNIQSLEKGQAKSQAQEIGD